MLSSQLRPSEPSTRASVAEVQSRATSVTSSFTAVFASPVEAASPPSEDSPIAVLPEASEAAEPEDTLDVSDEESRSPESLEDVDDVLLDAEFSTDAPSVALDAEMLEPLPDVPPDSFASEPLAAASASAVCCHSASALIDSAIAVETPPPSSASTHITAVSTPATARLQRRCRRSRFQADV